MIYKLYTVRVKKIYMMKKLLVLMIVLFPVTAWAGAHDIKKPRKVLCDDLYQNAPEKLRTIEFLNFMKSFPKHTQSQLIIG